METHRPDVHTDSGDDTYGGRRGRLQVNFENLPFILR